MVLKNSMIKKGYFRMCAWLDVDYLKVEDEKCLTFVRGSVNVNKRECKLC